MTTREVEWDDEERARVLALLEYEDQVCPGCGGYLPETTRDEAEFAYVAEVPQRCHRCTTVHRMQREYAKEVKDPESLPRWPVRDRRG